jgi:hypothetical protein
LLCQEHPTVSARQLYALLGVSRAWYYAQAAGPLQVERDVVLRDALERIALEFSGNGYQRVTAQLHRQNSIYLWDGRLGG